MTCKVMHQICYGFYWSIKKWSKLDQKADFLAHLENFFVYALLHSMSYAPKFCQMKDLNKIYICGKFHQYRKLLYFFLYLGIFSGTNGPSVKDQEVTAYVSTTFSKAHYYKARCWWNNFGCSSFQIRVFSALATILWLWTYF